MTGSLHRALGACKTRWWRPPQQESIVLAIGQGDALRWLLQKKAGQTLYCREAFHQAIQESSVSP